MLGVSHIPNPTLVTPVWRGGRCVWHESVADWFIEKLHYGDSTIGWEGDPRLFVVAEATPAGTVWELWRHEENGHRSMIEKSPPGYPFDERILVQLCKLDTQRQHRDLHAEVMNARDKEAADEIAGRNEYIAEELAPRLQRALISDGY